MLSTGDSKSNIQCFARQITKPQLKEYVETLPWRIQWVTHFRSDIMDLVNTRTSDVVFVQLAPDYHVAQQIVARGQKLWILNMEQMSRAIMLQDSSSPSQNTSLASTAPHIDEIVFDFERWIFHTLRKLPSDRVGIFDYSMENTKIWKKLFPTIQCRWIPFLPSKTTLFPLQPGPSSLSSPDDEDADEEVLKPVVFVGDTNSMHRKHLLTKLDDIVHVITKTFGHERDLQLQQFPILLNIHFGASYTIMEDIRILPAILRKQLVISEMSQIDPRHPFAEFVIFAQYDSLEACTRSVVAHKGTLWKQRYENNPKWNSLLEDISKFAETHNSIIS